MGSLQSSLTAFAAGCALLGASAPAATAQLTLIEVATIDLAPWTSQGPGAVVGPATPGGVISQGIQPLYIGTNPSAVAWDGTDLFVAGFNGNIVTSQVGIARIPFALLPPTNNPRRLSPVFGVRQAPPQRGFSGLDLQGDRLVAAYDPGSVDPQGLTGWSRKGQFLWAKEARGSCGIGLDPGFPTGVPALGEGAGWMTFGSGGRSLQDADNGADIYDTASGMSLFSPAGTFWRDIDFDDVTGDVWLREGNNVVHGVRSGDNAVSGVAVVIDPADADFVVGQNLAFCDRVDGDLIAYNDRPTSSTGAPFQTAVRFCRPDGTNVPYSVITNNPLPAGVGFYDFAFHAPTGTLAVLDFANRQVAIYLLFGAV